MLQLKFISYWKFNVESQKNEMNYGRISITGRPLFINTQKYINLQSCAEKQTMKRCYVDYLKKVIMHSLLNM